MKKSFGFGKKIRYRNWTLVSVPERFWSHTFHGGSIDLSNVYLFLYQKASDNVGDGDEAHMGEILELDVLEELQKTSDRDSPEAVERPVANHVLPNT